MTIIRILWALMGIVLGGLSLFMTGFADPFYGLVSVGILIFGIHYLIKVLSDL